jgi:hypothetical protein
MSVSDIVLILTTIILPIISGIGSYIAATSKNLSEK